MGITADTGSEEAVSIVFAPTAATQPAIAYPAPIEV